MNVNARANREKAHFDALARSEGAVWWGALTRAGKLRMDERANLAIRYGKLRKGTHVLEPGAGNAEFTLRLAKTGALIEGIELSAQQAALGNDRLAEFENARIIVGNIERLTYPDDFFDAVVGNSVLHHFDLNKALPEMLRVMKPGGCFFFCEPNMLNPQIALEKNIAFIGRSLQNSPDETAFFRWQIGKKLLALGFVEVTIRPFDFLHPGVPEPWIPQTMKLNKLLNKLPLVREIGGSLQIGARKAVLET